MPVEIDCLRVSEQLRLVCNGIFRVSRLLRTCGNRDITEFGISILAPRNGHFI
jgi:hypothetical protein